MGRGALFKAQGDLSGWRKERKYTRTHTRVGVASTL